MQQADALPAGNSPARLPAADAFGKIAATAPAGYRTLARLREAALQWDAGDTASALATWDAVGTDEAVDPQLRDVAALLWAQHSVDKGDPAAIAARTSKLEAPANPWRALAEEVDALVALRQGDKDKATRLLRTVMGDPSAAEGLRGRANALLTLLGASGGGTRMSAPTPARPVADRRAAARGRDRRVRHGRGLAADQQAGHPGQGASRCWRRRAGCRWTRRSASRSRCRRRC